MMPGASRRMDWARAALIGFSNSMLIASLWPTNTGTRTQVAVTSISGSRILRVSAVIFHSSFVYPSMPVSAPTKLSMCGMTLKAMRLVNFDGSGSSPTKMARVWLNSSSMPSLPAPDTD